MYKPIIASVLGFALRLEVLSLAIVAVWLFVAAYWLIRAAAEHGV